MKEVFELISYLFKPSLFMSQEPQKDLPRSPPPPFSNERRKSFGERREVFMSGGSGKHKLNGVDSFSQTFKTPSKNNMHFYSTSPFRDTLRAKTPGYIKPHPNLVATPSPIPPHRSKDKAAALNFISPEPTKTPHAGVKVIRSHQITSDHITSDPLSLYMNRKAINK